MQLLTDASKKPVMLRRCRFVGFLLLGFIASGIFITIIGAILGYSAIPLAAGYSAILQSRNTALMWVLSIGYSLGIWLTLYFAGRFYMKSTSMLGFKYRRETLTPIFISSVICWIPLMAIMAISSGINVGTGAILFGLALGLFGQSQQMVALKKSLPSDTTPFQIESAKPVNNVELTNQLYELKTAESIEHLEQMSKQCLLLIKPAAATQADCTSSLIDELMKRKLNTEADELSLLQLNLAER